MYPDRKNNRLLLKDGTSLMTPDAYASMLIEGKQVPSCARILDEEEALSYFQLYEEFIFYDEEDYEDPVPGEPEELLEDDFIDLLVSMPRFDKAAEIHGESFLERIEDEMDYFIRTNNVVMLRKCRDLITRFKEENIVWGIGRGSACASMVLYILEVHDIDPIRYDIPFSELSKEQEEFDLPGENG